MPSGVYKHNKYPKELYPNFGMRNKHHSKEGRRNIGKGNKGKKYPREEYPNFGNRGKSTWIKGLTKETDERVVSTGKKISKSLRGKTPWNKGIPWSEEIKRKIGEGNKGKIVSEKTMENQSKGQLKRFKDSREKKKLSKAHLGNQATKGMKFPKEIYPNFGTRGWKASEKTKERQSKIGKKHWQDPEYHKLMFETRNAKPNKLEKYFSGLVGDKIRFVGDYIFHIRTKSGTHNPDFKVNGQKKIIELFGDFYHKGENPNNLIENYKEVGWDCIIFWEHEVYNETERIKKEVEDFIKMIV